MKNKPLTYLLIVSVAAVWGIIFYRIFSAGNDEEEIFRPLVKSQFVNESLDDYSYKDTFTLVLNYRDPFLSTAIYYVEEKVAQVASKPIVFNAAPKRPAINWNIIKYTGFISNPSKKSVVAIMSINGKEYMMKEGELVAGVKILRNLKDSVKVSYQNSTRFISIK
jgi:hypothetical protein